MVSQKGALYDDDSLNRADEYFSDKSQGSKITNASSDSANGEGIELGSSRSLPCPYSGAKVQRSLGYLHGAPYVQAYRTQGQEREKGALGKPGFYVAVYNKGGKQKVGVL
jgi:hypothetical protein